MWTIFKVFTKGITVLLLFFCFIFLATRHVASWLPDQGLNMHPLHWKAKSLKKKKLFIYFNWRIITLQYCGGFCHTETWIGRRYTCVPLSWTLPHLPLHPIPPGCHRAPVLSGKAKSSPLGLPGKFPETMIFKHQIKNIWVHTTCSKGSIIYKALVFLSLSFSLMLMILKSHNNSWYICHKKQMW